MDTRSSGPDGLMLTKETASRWTTEADWLGKNSNHGVDPDLYASTPPLEAMRYIISQDATISECPMAIKINDMSRACFNAKAARDLFIEIPAEDQNKNCGRDQCC